MPFEMHYKDSVGSTMDVARAYIAEHKHCDQVVFQAGEQTGGRGRRGNQWLSPYGNLYQSIVFKPRTNRQYWGQMSFVLAVALGQSCVKIGLPPSKLQMKWPNDVLINTQKLGGLLIEVDDNHMIVGTGVNIEHAPNERAKIHDFSNISIHDFRDLFLEQIEHYYNQWEENGFVSIREQWMAQAYRLGQPILARVQNAEYEGVFDGLDEWGTLLLREKSGLIRKINAGEIIACS